jgi:hypothetical protein
LVSRVFPIVESIQDDYRPSEALAVVGPLGLLNLPDRATALRLCWYCIAVAVTGALCGTWYSPLFVFVLFLLSAAWFWSAIRWVDTKGTWLGPSEQHAPATGPSD